MDTNALAGPEEKLDCEVVNILMNIHINTLLMVWRKMFSVNQAGNKENNSAIAKYNG